MQPCQVSLKFQIELSCKGETNDDGCRSSDSCGQKVFAAYLTLLIA